MSDIFARQPLNLPLDRTAALFIDLQEEHRGDERLLAVEFDRVIANVQKLQAAARTARMPLYHFAYVVDIDAETTRRHHPRLEDGRSAFSDKNDQLSAICPEVAPAGGERLVVKTEASAFGAGFGDELAERGVEWLVIAGVWTEACVDATVKDALRRDLRVLLVKDACSSGSVTMHQTGILNLANRLYGGAVADTQTACRLIAGETVDCWSPRSPVPIRYESETVGRIYASL